jgi:type II secretory ATPase GspE/PulE/Tfp pilus assembly ATPase PilB-like protein
MLNAAIHSGMQTLLGDGIRKVVQGLTTYRQVRAVAAK